MQIIKANTIASRSELSREISLLGLALTTDLKPDYQIQGTAEELSRIGLSSSTMVWGIRCIATDEKTVLPDIPVPVVDRGPVQSSGINGNLKTNKIKK